MLGKKFQTWPTDPLSNTILVTFDMCVTNLGYREDGPPHFTKLLNGDTEESNRMLIRLDIAFVIPETND